MRPNGRGCSARAPRSRRIAGGSRRRSTPDASPTSCCSIPSCPRSVRFSVEHLEVSLRAITRLSGREDAGRPERLAGRLRSGLHYAQLDEIMADSLQHFLESVRRQCAQVHTATYQTFIDYQVQSAIA